MTIKMRAAAPLVGALLTMLLGAATGESQPPPPPPPPPPEQPRAVKILLKDPAAQPGKDATLEAKLQEALKNNPDVRVAEVKVHEAEAELNRARLQVMQKVVSLNSAIEAARANLKQAEASYARVLKLRASGALAAEEAQAAEEKLLAAKGRVATLDVDLDFLQGKTKAVRLWLSTAEQKMKGSNDAVWVDVGPAAGAMRIWRMDTVEFQPAAPGGHADKIRKALDAKVSVDYQNAPLGDVLKDFQTKYGIIFVLASKKVGGETKVNLQLKEMPFGAVLELLEDTVADVHFAVRDYGVLVTSAEHLPAGALPLYTFWKAAAKAPVPGVPPGLPVIRGVAPTGPLPPVQR